MALDAVDRGLVSWLKTPHGGRSACLVVVAAIALILFLRLGEGPVEHTTERRCAKVVSHMVATDDWLVPIKDGKPRLEKPPLYYWLATATTHAVSDRMTPGTLRFPSAVMALLMAVLCALWARSLGGWPLALGSSLALLGMFHFFTLARRGVAETTLAVAALLAWMTFDRMHFRGERKLLPWFAACFAVAWLAKATVSVLLIGLPIAFYLWREHKLKQAISRRLLAWLAVAFAVGVAWYVIVLLRVPGAWNTFWSELRNSAGVPDEGASARHYDWPHFYVKELALLAIPVVALAPFMIARLIHTGVYREEPRKRFLAFVFLTLFVAWSLLPKKQRHYMVPLLPVFATLMAEATLAYWAQRRTLVEKLMPTFAVIAALGAIAGGAYVGVWMIKVRALPPIMSGGVLIAMALLALGMFVAGLQRRALAFLALGFITLVLSFGATFGFVRPWEDTVRAAVDDEATALPDEARLVALSRDAPWILKLYGLGDDIRDHADRLTTVPHK